MPVLLAMIEDDGPFAAAMRSYFDLTGEVRCTAIFPSAEAALEGLPALTPAPSVLLVDIHLPHMSGIDLVSRVKTLCPRMQCLMVTMYEDSTRIFDALKAGASGYLLKRTPLKEVVAAILQVHAGGAPMSPEIARRVVSFFYQGAAAPAPIPELAMLPVREKEVLELLSKGYLYKEIADLLSISTHTVNTHIRRIYEKLHVKSRSQAVAKYHGLE